jgi:hypothetical protein
MNTEYVQSLLAGLDQAKQALAQWNEYKTQIEAVLKDTLNLTDQDALSQQLFVKRAGSMTLKPCEGLEAKFSVELSFDQAKIAETILAHPELIGLVVKTQYMPASAKAVFTLLAHHTPASESVHDALKVVNRGPYLSLASKGE